jgi:hypothetical protein
MLYAIVRAEGERGPWKVRTEAYYYALHDPDARELVAYHWHPDVPGPDAGRRPHLHLGAGAEVGSMLRKCSTRRYEPPLSARSIRSAASRCIASLPWTYVFMVMLTCVWPRISMITRGVTP